MIVAVILALLASGLGWTAVLRFGFPWWLGPGVSGSALLLIAIVWLVRKLRARKSATQLETDINAQAQEVAKTVRPDLQPEIQAMQAEFNKAIGALKSSKLARGGRDALAVLPWYVILGPPGAGKSTALRNSGLKFPYLSSRGGGVRGVGGTRNCDWWLTNDAVLLDTAGRYSTGDEDRDEWLAFLDILARNRPRRPINGLIVAISVSELLAADHQIAGELGQRIRERLDELTSRLKVVVPIYVVITKCDLLTGFQEMYSDLPRSERGQIWGFTVPLSAQPEAASDLLLERFDELSTVLEQRSLRRLGQERRLESRERIYQFPQRFAALRKNLTEFIQPLFMENVFQDTPVMRGVYFTSATQDVRPIERVTQSMAELFGTARPVEQAADGKSFFLWDVFNKVMFQDQKMAVRSSLEEIRIRKRRLAVAGVGMATALATLILPTISFFENRDLVRSIRDSIVHVQLDERDEISRVNDLSTLQGELATLTSQRTEGVPFYMRFGMYKGDDLYPLAKRFYNGALRRVLIGRQFERLAQGLGRFEEMEQRPDWKPDKENFGRDFDDLKMYLLVTKPHGMLEPALDATQQDWLVRRLVSHWTNATGLTSTVSSETITKHARTFVAMLASEPDLAFDRNERVVRSARRALNRVPRTQLELDRIIDSVDQEYGKLTLPEMMAVVPAVSSPKLVRGAFTKTAYEQVVRDRLENAFKNTESWVLDRDSKEDERVARTDLKTRYFRQYIIEWTEFLGSINVQSPENLSQTAELLEGLTKGKPPPYGQLFRTVVNNVQLEKPGKLDATGSSITKWFSGTFGSGKQSEQPAPRDVIDTRSPTGEEVLTARDVERTFAGLIKFTTVQSPSEDGEEKLTQFDFYQEQLARVLETLKQVKDKPSESITLVEKIRISRTNVEIMLSKLDTWGVVMGRMLMPPLSDVNSLVFRNVAGDKSHKWCEDVANPLRGLMAHRYPFDANTLQDAPLAEVVDYLRPENGKLRKFYQEQLKDDLVKEGRKFNFATLQAKGIYKDELLSYMEKEGVFATALFPGDTVEPLVRFQVRIQPAVSDQHPDIGISAISFTLDGNTVNYQNGPEAWSIVQWPGQAGKMGANLHVRSNKGEADIIGEGDWGLFRLLDRVKRVEPSADGRFFTAVWQVDELDGVELKVDIRPERTTNPFFGMAGNTSKLLAIFRDPGLLPPLGIARGDKGCSPDVVSAKTVP